MITTAALTGSGAFDQLTDLRNAISKSLLAQNPGMKLLDGRVQQDDARLSTYGKAALALDDMRTAAAKLSAAKPGGDAAQTSTAVKDFVKAFNTMSGKLASLQSGDGQLDRLLDRVQDGLDGILGGANGKALAGIGISRGKDGLVVNEDKLKAALATDPSAVDKLFSGKDGLAERLAGQIGSQLGDGGQLAKQAEQVKEQRDRLLGQKSAITATVDRQAAMLAQQYQLIGSGGDPALGGLGRPMSLFDVMA